MHDRPSVQNRDRLGIATVMARKGVAPEAIGALLGVAMPDQPRACFAAGRTVLGTGPGAWLVIDEDPAPDFADTLHQALAGLASVAEQSGSVVVQRVSGAGARTLLQRGAAIDFHPASFATGSVAITVIARIGVTIWQVDEQPTYDVAVGRSYGGSFRHWIEQTLHE